MKKLIAMILVASLMICTLSACGDTIVFQTGRQGETNYAGVETDNDLNELDSNSKENSKSESSNSNSNSKPNKNNEESTDVSNEEYVMPENPDTPLRKNELPNYSLDMDYLRTYEQDGRYIKLVQNSNLNKYNGYINDLKKAGFSIYDQNTIGTNQFTTLINKTTFVSVSFTTGNNSLKVVSEPLGDLYPRKQDNKYTEKNIQSLFTGVKNENHPIYSGMGFIIRLSDGSFIIIDGGGGDYNSVDSNKFLKILKDQSPKGTKKPVIAAWIFTHCHDDHIGVFNAFSKDHHDEVIIESIYYNFPPEDAIRKHADFMFDNAYYSYPTMEKCIKDYYSDAKIIRPHSGEKYYIRNSIIDMLFSYEDLYPDSLTNGGVSDFNATSLVFKINIGGQSMLITGDANSKSALFLTKNYGNNLKSDILQLAHHGQNDLLELYKLANPTYALLPVTHVDEKRMSSIAANRWISNSQNVRQVIAFWNKSVTIPLPYNPKDSEIFGKLPDRNTTYYNYPLT